MFIKWFKHDSNASIDARLKRVRMKYDMEGYGLYWYCLELVAKNVEKHNLTFELEEDAELISQDTKIHKDRIQEMMTDFINWGLFENTDGAITCLKMARRTDEYTQKVIKTQGLLLPSVQCPDSVPTKSDLIEENRIEQNRTEKKRVEPKNKPFKPPSLDQVKDYCQQRKNKISPEDFIDYYQACGWMRGRAKIKDWKACVRTWEKFERDKEVQKKPKSDHEWQTLGQEKGINAKPGETMWNYISRVRDSVYGH